MAHEPAAGRDASADTTPGTVVVITTGGTISATGTPDGAVPRHGPDQLVPPALRGRVSTIDLMAVDSSAMRVADQFAILIAIDQALRDPTVTGVVVTHGTDTMEETAMLADLYIADERPVVFTGAQRPADHRAPDGPANLAHAIAVAAGTAERGRGVLVALGGRILPARGIYKSSTTELSAFDTVHPDLRRPQGIGPIPAGRVARVDLLALYPGVAPGLIAAAVSQNAAGIVLAATGSGNTHPDLTAEVALAVRQGTTVVLTSRVPDGPVIATYGGGGGAVDLERAGAIISPWLRAPQARIALIALLSAGADRDRVRRFFADSVPHR